MSLIARNIFRMLGLIGQVLPSYTTRVIDQIQIYNNSVDDRYRMYVWSIAEVSNNASRYLQIAVHTFLENQERQISIDMLSDLFSELTMIENFIPIFLPESTTNTQQTFIETRKHVTDVTSAGEIISSQQFSIDQFNDANQFVDMYMEIVYVEYKDSTVTIRISPRNMVLRGGIQNQSAYIISKYRELINMLDSEMYDEIGEANIDLTYFLFLIP